jgi:hypothetical protein
MGIVPDLNEIKKTNEDLYEMLWNGPDMPAHYRLLDKPEMAITYIQEAYDVRLKFLSVKNSV